MPAYRWSRRMYRALLRVYPSRFRARFASDLDADFADMLATRGRRAAWSGVLLDLAASLWPVHRHARATGRRRQATHPILPAAALASAGSVHSGGTPMSSLLVDLRYTVRALVKAPVFTVVTVLTLALGIGANSAVFSLVNRVLLQPLGYERPERLMLVHEGIPESGVPRFGVSPADFIDLTLYQHSFSAIGAYRIRSMELSGAGESEQVPVAQVSAAVFSILGVDAAVGRTFEPADEASGEAVAVLSHGLWLRRYGGRAVIGDRVLLDRQPYTIVGIMPASFQFPTRGPQLNGEPAGIWAPLVFNPFERQARGMFYNHSVVGRLRDGVTPEQAGADTAALAPRIRENYPPALKNSPFSLVVSATPLTDEVAGQVRAPLLVLLGAVGLVLLVACANVANLILSRAVTREREIGLRAALGAARRRLFQMQLIESILLTLAGGLLGLAIGFWAVRAMPAVIAASLPGVSDVTLDGRVVVFTLTLSGLTAIFFGLVPVVAGQRRDLNDLLREGAWRATSGRRQHRVQAGLVVSSIALAFVLLVGAGLLIRSFSRLLSVDVGVRTTNVLAMRLTLPPAGYRDAATVRAFYRNLHDRLRAVPGIRATSISTDLPLRGDGERRAFTPDRPGEEAGLPPSVAVTWVYGDYFGTFGIPIVRGRTFTPEEAHENRSVAIVSRALAERFWAGRDAVGQRIKWGIAASTAPWMTVVGVAGDVVDGRLGDDPVIHVYVPYSEVPDAALAGSLSGLMRQMTIGAHGTVSVATLAGPARAAVASLDSALALAEVTTMMQVVGEALAPQRFSAIVLAAFSAGALLLAAIGLYGVLAFGVAQRTREIGVRLALGAGRAEVVRLVVGQGMTLAAMGLLLGGVIGFAATRVMRSLLFETTTHDPWTFAAVPVAIGAVAFLACYLPAHRAARVDPMVALRIE
jgi:putative ABC transport system permease protein